MLVICKSILVPNFYNWMLVMCKSIFVPNFVIGCLIICVNEFWFLNLVIALVREFDNRFGWLVAIFELGVDWSF